MLTYLELVDDKSSKFWEVTRSGSSLTIRYGKIGTDGRTQEKSFGSDAAATKEADKLVAQKTKKGYVDKTPKGKASESKPETAPIAPASEPKAAPAKTPEPEAEPDGLRWVPLEDGSALAFEDGKIVGRNKKGKRLKSPSKKMLQTEIGEQLADVAKLQKEHAQECLETVERWMLRSLPVPTTTLIALWPDPHWRRLLDNTVVAPAPGTPEADDPDLVGILRAIGERGLGLVNLDGETVWTRPAAIVIPHPILLEDLADWRSLVAELEVAQGLGQLMRETFARPDGLDPTARGLDEFSGGKFEMLAHAIGRTRAIGCRVSGGFATTTVWENELRYQAQFWIGAEDPYYETETGELMWSDGEKSIAVASVPPVSFSEGMRMASLIYAKRKIEEQEEEK